MERQAVDPGRGGARGASARLRVAAAFVRHFLAYLTVDVVAAVTRRRSLPASAGYRARALLAGMGPVNGRLGRLLGAYATLVPGGMMTGLASGPAPEALPASEVRRLVAADLGPVSSVFSAFSDVPLSVSDGFQIHTGALTDGREVLVRVSRTDPGESRPGFLVAAALGRLLPRGIALDAPGALAGWTEPTGTSLAETLAVAAEALARVPAAVAPRPVDGLAGRRVVVTEGFGGVPLSGITDSEAASRAATGVVDALLACITQGSFVPAGLDPAGVLVAPDGRVCLLGITGRADLDEDQRAGLVDLLAGRAAGEIDAQIAALDALGALGPEADRRELWARLTWVRDSEGDLFGRDPLFEIPRVFRFISDAGITAPASLVHLGEDLVVLEALVRSHGAHVDYASRIRAATGRRSRRSRGPLGPLLSAEEIRAAAVPPITHRPPHFSDLRAVFSLMPASMRFSRENWTESVANLGPFAVFIALNSALGFTAGVIGLTVSLVVAQLAQRLRGGRRMSRGVLALIIFTVVQGAVGVAFHSKGAVFGPAIITPALIGLTLGFSIMAGRPLVGLLANLVWPQVPAVRKHPSMSRAFHLLTLIFSITHLTQFAVLLWALIALSANSFVGLQQAVGLVIIPQLLIMVVVMTRVVSRAPTIEAELIRTFEPGLLRGGAGWPETGIILEASGIDAGYGPIQVLFGPSITVRRGERVALLGTNGAGKSTLLRVVAGLIHPTSGVVWFKGHDITAASQKHRVDDGLVYIAGGRATFPSLTVLDNLRVSTYQVRRDRAEVDRRIEEAFDLFPRLRERATQKAGTLSGGEQQMVAIGRALVAQPDLLMIDELSLGLAPILLLEIQRMIQTLADRGMTMLIVEQSLNMAASIAERAYFMEKGEIRFEGPISELIGRGDLARSVFLGADKAGGASSDTSSGGRAVGEVIDLTDSATSTTNTSTSDTTTDTLANGTRRRAGARGGAR